VAELFEQGSLVPRAPDHFHDPRARHLAATDPSGTVAFLNRIATVPGPRP
jgi:hypothetical protein